jgi:hypothetical protein
MAETKASIKKREKAELKARNDAKLVGAGHDLSNYMKSTTRTLKNASIQKEKEMIHFLIREIRKKVEDVSRFVGIDSN